MKKENNELTNIEKLELLKEALGWVFDGVVPMAWNPYENPKHLGILLKHVSTEDNVTEYFQKVSEQSFFQALMMPFSDPSTVIDMCGNFLGLWIPEKGILIADHEIVVL